MSLSEDNVIHNAVAKADADIANNDVFDITDHVIEHADAKINSKALFIGDNGELPVDTRRVFVQLLSGPCIDGKRHQILWSTLIRDEIGRAHV